MTLNLEEREAKVVLEVEVKRSSAGENLVFGRKALNAEEEKKKNLRWVGKLLTVVEREKNGENCSEKAGTLSVGEETKCWREKLRPFMMIHNRMTT